MQPTTQQTQAQQQTQQQQDDLFSSSSQLPNAPSAHAFRFGGQSAVGQSSQSGTSDDYPPLNRNTNGEIGQDRGSGLLQNVGFTNQPGSLGFGAGAMGLPQSGRNNGLLNALSGTHRTPSIGQGSTSSGPAGKYVLLQFVPI